MKLWVPHVAMAAVVLALIAGAARSMLAVLPDRLENLPFARTFLLALSLYAALLLLGTLKRGLP